MKFFLTLALVFLFFLSSGQSFNGGLRIGISASQVNGDRLQGFDKVGLIGGGFVNRYFSENFAVQMEIIFIQKGSRKPTDLNNQYYRLRVHYIEVPVLARIRVSKSFEITAGPAYGTLIFSEENDQFGIFRYSPPFRKYELSAHIGAIYKLSEKWHVDGRYSRSISTIRPFPGAINSFFDEGQYNEVIELSLLRSF